MTCSTQGLSYRILVIFLVLPFCASRDTITADHPLRANGEVLISAGKTFALGFFGMASMSDIYVGIYYNQGFDPLGVVWVANRDNGARREWSKTLAIDVDTGGLVMYQNNQTSTETLWSSGVSANGSTFARLLDDGNLVLLQNDTNQKVLWQSFDHPTDVWLPFMKLNDDMFLTTSNKECYYGIDSAGLPQLFLKDQSSAGLPALFQLAKAFWRGHGYGGIPETALDSIFNISVVDNEDRISFTYSTLNNSSIFPHFKVEYPCKVIAYKWHDQDHKWVELWSAPTEWCDSYGQCGSNGNCDPSIASDNQCKCLPGFEPKSPGNRSIGTASSGCVRRKGVSVCRNGEGFVKLTNVKLPATYYAHVNERLSLEECEQWCRENCTCAAYARPDLNKGGGVGCLTWHGDLDDLRTYSSGGKDLYVRVDAITLAEYANQEKEQKLENSSLSKKQMLGISLSSIVVFFLIMLLAFQIVKRRRKGLGQIELGGIGPLPQAFSYAELRAATRDFSSSNKLGRGGFGSVYKGELLDGRVVAVKQLSMESKHGEKQFLAEISTISVVQHRNLVKLYGYCIDRNRRFLVYEHLENKSLDQALFGKNNLHLDWRARFNICLGTARGLAYLHEESKPRIIHRDIKAGNILLSEVLFPKISDFGLATLFDDNKTHVSTGIAGTRGYWAPEYAMRGRLTEKADVFAFGVVTLEIVSGRPNLLNSPDSEDLLQSAWSLYENNRILELVDSTLPSFDESEAIRMIKIAFLCTQLSPTLRPPMSRVVAMLTEDIEIGNSISRPSYLSDVDLNEHVSIFQHSNVTNSEVLEGR